MIDATLRPGEASTPAAGVSLIPSRSGPGRAIVKIVPHDPTMPFLVVLQAQIDGVTFDTVDGWNATAETGSYLGFTRADRPIIPGLPYRVLMPVESATPCRVVIRGG